MPIIDETGHWGKTGARPKPEFGSWWSPPKFPVLDRAGNYAVVTGADYNTHAGIRSLKTRSHSGVMNSTSLTREVSQATRNEPSTVQIHLWFLEGDPPYQIPGVITPDVFGE